MVVDSIISRVQKLISLSKNNNNVNEASAAASAAQKLIDQYNLDMAQIAVDNGGDRISDEEITRDHEPLYNGRNSISWKVSLAEAVSRSNNCRVFLSGGTINIVGKQTPVALTRFLYSYVQSEIERLSAAAMQVNSGAGKSYSNNFKLGAVTAVRDNLKRSRAEINTKYSGTQAMVIVNNESREVDSWLSRNMSLRTKTRVHTKYDNNARSDGYNAGSRIDLNRTGLNGSVGARLLNK